MNAARRPLRPWDLRKYKEGTILAVKVQTNAKKNALEAESDGRVRIKLTASPVEGAANAQCIQYVSKQLRFPQSQIEMVKGQRSKEKWLWFKGVSPSEMIAVLTAKRDLSK